MNTQPSQNAMALAQQMTGQQQIGPPQPAQLGQPQQQGAPQPQGLDIAGLLGQVQQLQQMRSALQPGQPEQGAQDPDEELHHQLARMNPAQMLHTMGRAKAVAATMQHLRTLRAAGSAATAY
jgi:hypothetical protein